jgi:hypothetical protein
MKAKTIELVPWKWQGVLVAGGTIAQFAALVKRDAGADIDASPYSAGHAYVEYGKPWYLWVESIDDVPSLAHEAFHVTSGVLEGRGLKLSHESEEAYTYTLSHILTHAVNRKGWERVRV